MAYAIWFCVGDICDHSYSKNKTGEKLRAIMSLDSLLRIEFELDPIDDRSLLMQAHGLLSMPTPITLPKHYALVKGKPKTVYKLIIEGSKFYRVDLLIKQKDKTKHCLNISNKHIIFVNMVQKRLMVRRNSLTINTI